MWTSLFKFVTAEKRLRTAALPLPLPDVVKCSKYHLNYKFWKNWLIKILISFCN
jgi:hypothetical protein